MSSHEHAHHKKHPAKPHTTHGKHDEHASSRAASAADRGDYDEMGGAYAGDGYTGAATFSGGMTKDGRGFLELAPGAKAGVKVGQSGRITSADGSHASDFTVEQVWDRASGAFVEIPYSILGDNKFQWTITLTK